MWWTWIVDNWELWAPLAVALAAAIVNAVTRHPGTVSQPVLHWLLLLVDWLSVLVSRGSERSEGGNAGLRVKLPIVQMSPPPEPSQIKRSVAMIKAGER
jgi:hypothetical protein